MTWMKESKILKVDEYDWYDEIKFYCIKYSMFANVNAINRP